MLWKHRRLGELPVNVVVSRISREETLPAGLLLLLL